MQGKRLGAYTLISELGSGGTGTVYLAGAKRPFDLALEQASADCRAGMIESKPFHRAIARAWKEHEE